jgi:putative PIN family toxin of toxin-antitoxin system
VRIFLDTNVLASAIATRGICADVLHVAMAEHDLVIIEQVLTELGRVLREKFRTPDEVAQETEDFLRREAEVVARATKLDFTVRDTDDVAIVEHAVAGNADLLVTGDRDLIEAVDPPLRILTPRGFWDLLRSQSTQSDSAV